MNLNIPRVVLCERCEYGLVRAPPAQGRTPLWHARLLDFQTGELEFCDCKNGEMYHRFLDRLRDRLLEEARQQALMQQHAQENTHPELERVYGRGRRDYDD